MTSASANERLKSILRAGKLFEGKYRIIRPLGAGSFAVVVHARHEVMERDVALKFLKPKVVASNPEVASRFIKEVRIASKLKHPNVVAIYDFGKTEDGIHYMVQEFVDGGTLDEVHPPGQALAPERAVFLLKQVLSCLQEAHDNMIIHRDLKPSNLMLTKSEQGEDVIKILDFGVAKLLEDNQSGGPKRQSTKFIGTPIYMSPEQILGQQVRPASDLYSVGLMFYEMLTGDPPIHAEQVAEVVQRHLSDTPLAFPKLRKLPPHIAEAILRATRRYPDDRFASADQFASALSQRESTLDESNEGYSDVAGAVRVDQLNPSLIGPGERRQDVSLAKGFGSADELDDVFSGRNYVSMPEDDFGSTSFEAQGEYFNSPSASREMRAARANMPEPGAEFLAAAREGSVNPRSSAPRSSNPRSAGPRSSNPMSAGPASSSPGRAHKRPDPIARAAGASEHIPRADAAPSSSAQRMIDFDDSGADSPTDDIVKPLNNGLELELDLDAVREVKQQRRGNTVAQPAVHRSQRPTAKKVPVKRPLKEQDESLSAPDLIGRVLTYAGAAFAGYVSFAIISAMFPNSPGLVRGLLGFLPLPAALAWGWSGERLRRGDFGARVLLPSAMRVFVLTGVVILGVVLVLPDKGRVALKQDVVWFSGGAAEPGALGSMTLAWSVPLANVCKAVHVSVYGGSPIDAGSTSEEIMLTDPDELDILE